MNKYIISEKDLKELIEDSWELTRLINNGVDNWEGYGYEDEDEDEDNINVNDYIKQNYEKFLEEGNVNE